MHEWMVKDQVIVVAGGSKGIGLGTVQALWQRGARVAVLARDAARLREEVDRFGSDRIVGVAVDVCDKQKLAAAYGEIQARWGRVDGVVNNVGYQFPRRIESMPEAEVRKIVELNYFSTIFSCQVAIPLLRAGGGGRIVNISSASVRSSNEFAHIGLYSSCKAAVDQFTAELRREVMADGILVTLFSPGSVFTGSVDNFDQESLADAYRAWLDSGPSYGGSTTPEAMGAAIAQCFEYPPGLAAEFVEVKPGILTPKALEETSGN